MDADLLSALQWLSAEQSFQLVFDAYDHLASPALTGADASQTRQLLLRLRAGDSEAALGCVAKMMEESDEVRGVMMGTHKHADRPLRETLVMELTQVLYWPSVLAVGRGLRWEQTGLPAVLANTPGTGSDRPEARILRKAFGFLMTATDLYARVASGDTLTSAEVALAELAQMSEKPYLAGFLRERLLK